MTVKHLFPVLVALSVAAAPLAAATYKNSTYQAVTQSVAVSLTSRGSGGTRPAKQVFVSVTRLDGAPVRQGDMTAAGGFASVVACSGGKPLGTVVAGIRGAAAEFEVLCVEG
ncbi:hypothetical protein Q4577_21020 [Marinovum sp. 2_MG-2023]|uniref:hypothetical protein n=1 Tax=Marinovum sp. 2_MG-2023 TaxID=3062637 RepID=UPI0026E44F02|nr:hypothetical protein [Marinovum sp. 2_MG-2023]MDO6732515.1 hypothetical protein [Marinovum sp. 2_MG-2023]MDO6780503.1 hypothetical protein [Marinovum sp. 1_MG-2023]